MADEIKIEFVRSEKIKTGCRIAVFKLRLDESLNDINGEIDYLFDGHKQHLENVLRKGMDLIPFAETPYFLIRYHLSKQYPRKIVIMTVRYAIGQHWFADKGYIQYLHKLA